MVLCELPTMIGNEEHMAELVSSSSCYTYIVWQKFTPSVTQLYFHCVCV